MTMKMTEGVTREGPVRGEVEEERVQEGVSTTTNVKADETLEMFHTTAQLSPNLLPRDSTLVTIIQDIQTCSVRNIQQLQTYIVKVWKRLKPDSRYRSERL